MVIKIEEPKKEGYKPTLRASYLQEFEYFVVEISGEYDEPLKFTNTFDGVAVESEMYNLILHEYVTVDPKTVSKVEFTGPPKTVGFFAKVGSGIQKVLSQMEKGQKVRFYQELTEMEIDGKKTAVRLWKSDIKTAPQSESKRPNFKDKAIALKKDGLDEQTIINLISSEYDGVSLDELREVIKDV